MDRYPLIFTQNFDILVADLAARATVHGRALMTWEDDAWWCHGVEPGGITGSGESPALAFAAFKASMATVLEDLAEEAGDFDPFASSVWSFVLELDEAESALWQEAREAIRAGSEIASEFSNLGRETRDFVASVRVGPLELAVDPAEELMIAEAA